VQDGCGEPMMMRTRIIGFRKDHHAASISRQVGYFFFCEHRVSGCLQSERKIVTMPFV